MKLVPITIDDLNKLNVFERQRAIRKYQKWLNRQRKIDRNNEHKLQNRIYRFKYPEKVKEAKEKWRNKNKIMCKVMAKQSALRRKNKVNNKCPICYKLICPKSRHCYKHRLEE